LIDFIRKNTLRFLGHFLISLAAAAVIVVLIAGAFQVSATLSGEFMGDKFAMIQSNVPYWARACCNQTACFLPSGFISFKGIPPEADRWTMVLAGFVFGVITWIIRMAVLGVVLVNFCVAGTISYLSLQGISAGKQDADQNQEGKEKAPPAKKPGKTKKKTTGKKESSADAKEKPTAGPEKKKEEPESD